MSSIRKVFEFIGQHQGCLSKDIYQHMGKPVPQLLDEMERWGLLVRVTKRDRFMCQDRRAKFHYTADQHPDTQLATAGKQSTTFAARCSLLAARCSLLAAALDRGTSIA